MFPTFFEEPGSAAADNKYKGVLFNFEGQQFTFPAYHDEVMKMFMSAVSAQLNLSEADIMTRCRKAVMRANNPKLDIYAGVYRRRAPSAL